nr:MAG TPA: hypothetical protein [Caudoviricetes sp.]
MLIKIKNLELVPLTTFQPSLYLNILSSIITRWLRGYIYIVL